MQNNDTVQDLKQTLQITLGLSLFLLFDNSDSTSIKSRKIFRGIVQVPPLDKTIPYKTGNQL